MLKFINAYLNQAGADGAAGGGAAAGSTAAAAPTTAPAAAPAAAPGVAAPSSLVAEAKPTIPTATEQGGKPTPAAGAAAESKPAAPAAAAPTKEAMQARLIAKGGKKEDVEKLSDADLAKQYEAVKPPEYGDFKLPDTVKLDAALMPELKKTFAKHDLTQQQAEGILAELGDKIVSTKDAEAFVKAELEKPYQLWADTQTDWQAKTKADPEVGGANFDKTLATIASGIDQFAKNPDEAKAIRQAFAITGAGNNPEIIRLMFRAFAPYMEGGHLGGGKPAGSGGKSAAEVMYPSMAGPGNQQKT